MGFRRKNARFENFKILDKGYFEIKNPYKAFVSYRWEFTKRFTLNLCHEWAGRIPVTKKLFFQEIPSMNGPSSGEIKWKCCLKRFLKLIRENAHKTNHKRQTVENVL